jgi:fumarate hydratase subunit beta
LQGPEPQQHKLFYQFGAASSIIKNLLKDPVQGLDLENKIRIKLVPPLSEEQVRKLKAGDEVTISGSIYSARDMAHKRLCELIDAGKELPIELEGAVIYFVGPTPARPGRVIGSAGPTTSSRMDAFSPKLIAKGLRAMIGKGYRGSEVRQSCKKYGAVHLAVIGGAGALLSKHITASEIVAYEDLGTEAIRRLEVKDFPAIVAFDSHGNSIYENK